MNLAKDEVRELKVFSASVETGTEGGREYVIVNGVSVPGWEPNKVDVLLCPYERDGYPSRLFLSAKVAGRGGLNWNSEARLLGRNWFAFSFKVPHSDLRLAQLLAAHMRALR
ncbi:MAG: hypothetical protein QM817_40850 [Archangium sp.]